MKVHLEQIYKPAKNFLFRPYENCHLPYWASTEELLTIFSLLPFKLQMRSNSAEIFHHGFRMRKDLMIDSLQNISFECFLSCCYDKERIVDITISQSSNTS